MLCGGSSACNGLTVEGGKLRSSRVLLSLLLPWSSQDGLSQSKALSFAETRKDNLWTRCKKPTRERYTFQRDSMSNVILTSPGIIDPSASFMTWDSCSIKKHNVFVKKFSTCIFGDKVSMISKVKVKGVDVMINYLGMAHLPEAKCWVVT